MFTEDIVETKRYRAQQEADKARQGLMEKRI